MKISFPLSLKISLWLLFNLLLLAAVGVGFLLVHGGLGWNALMNGAAGDHVRALGETVMGEVSAAPAGARDGVLARYGREYGAQFYLFSNFGPRLAGELVDLPATVRAQLVPPGSPGAPRPGPGLDGPRDRPPPPFDGGPPDGRPPPRASGYGPPPNEPPADGPGGGRRRMLLHDGGYWIGLRVPFRPSEDEPRLPATLFIHPASSWGLLRLLDVQPWLLTGGVVIVFSVLFWLPLVHGITRALGQLTVATGKIADGEFSTRVPATRRDEIGRLGESVNQMAGRLDTLVNGQKRFLGDIAHELGSPIGRLQVATEILEAQADPKLRPQVSDVREEVQQMAALVNELLAFTKAGLRPRDAVLATVAVGDVVASVMHREDPASLVRLELEPDLHVRAEPGLLQRALGNLVRNALRYAGDAGPVVLRARREDSRVFVSVEDEGPGVPPAALARLGEPFYRPEVARTRETGGVGLGLAIVRSGVAACGGEVHFSNRTPRGFRAEVRLAAG